MQPQDQTNNRAPKPNSWSSQASSPNDTPKPQQAAADVIRSKISSIYAHDPSANQTLQPAEPVVEPKASSTETKKDNIAQPDIDVNPYERTHAPNPQPQLEQWRHYHSAWQNYYQKYYEGYYTHHLRQTEQQLKTKYANQPAPTPTGSNIPPNQPIGSDTQDSTDHGPTKGEAMYQLRQKLRQKIYDSAHKVRKSRHFVPIVAGLVVVVIFLFLQYNRVLIANVKAYISPGNIEPQNIVVDPTASVSVGLDPKLIIPKINVNVPVVYNVGNDQTSQLAAMTRGVAHFAIPGASSVPGQIGNTVIAGHSSNDILDTGDYKFIFAQLEKLTVGDIIYMNYEGTRYTYAVTKTEEVQPTEVNKLVYETNKPVLTLVTCVPLGTAQRRLLVTAEQISPDPTASATAAPEASDDSTETEMPGNSPTLLQRIFGG